MDLIHTLYEPRGTGPHPTLLALHGWGASALDLIGLAPYVSGGRFLVLCPQGLTQTPIGPRAVGYGWYPSSGGGPPQLPAVVAAREQVHHFLEQAGQRYPIDPDRLVVLGFSQGGVMAYSLALGAPDRFAALVAISTWLPPELLEQLAGPEAWQTLPVFVQHGSKDDLVPVDRARKSVETLRRGRMPLTYREYDIGHEINAQSLADISSWLDENVR